MCRTLQDDSILFPGMADLRSERTNGAATDTSAAADAAAKPKGILSDDDVTKKAQGTFAEFLSIRDYKEAEACIAELHCSEAQEALVVTAALQVRPRPCRCMHKLVQWRTNVVCCRRSAVLAAAYICGCISNCKSSSGCHVRGSRATTLSYLALRMWRSPDIVKLVWLWCRLALMLKRMLTGSRSSRY